MRDFQSINQRSSPFPSFVLAQPLPRIRSHMRKARSFPTLRATLPEGCTATELTRPLCPFSVRKTAQSLARNRHNVPSSEADRRWDLEGKERCVMEPENEKKIGEQGIFKKKLTTDLRDASAPQFLSSASNPKLLQSRLHSLTRAISLLEATQPRL